MDPVLWSEIVCPSCGCNLCTDGGFDEMELGIGWITGFCDQCDALLDVELAGPGWHYVINSWDPKPPGGWVDSEEK